MTAEIPASIAATAIPLEDDATQRLEQLGKAFDEARVKLRVLKSTTSTKFSLTPPPLMLPTMPPRSLTPLR